jgi:hypothetical protein
MLAAQPRRLACASRCRLPTLHVPSNTQPPQALVSLRPPPPRSAALRFAPARSVQYRTLSAALARLLRRSSWALRCSPAHSGQAASPSPRVRRLKLCPHRK